MSGDVCGDFEGESVGVCGSRLVFGLCQSGCVNIVWLVS